MLLLSNLKTCAQCDVIVSYLFLGILKGSGQEIFDQSRFKNTTVSADYKCHTLLHCPAYITVNTFIYDHENSNHVAIGKICLTKISEHGSIVQ